MQETLLKLISLSSIVIICISFIFIFLNILGKGKIFKNIIVQYRLNILFFVSLAATVGSLLLSIAFKLPACELCWYQRVFMFTLPVITYIAILKNDLAAHVYVFWLSCIGLLISIYHSLLQSKIFTADTVFCNPASGIDCSVPAFMYYGFVTVPIISFSMFLLLMIISYEYKKV